MAIVIDEMPDVFTGDAVAARVRAAARASLASDVEETAVDLGLWLSGIDAFLQNDSNADPATKTQLVRSVLERCIMLNSRLTATDAETAALSCVLREGFQISRNLKNAPAGDNRAWHRVFSDRLRGEAAFHTLTLQAERSGEWSLPGELTVFMAAAPGNEEEAELALVVPRLGKILRSLNVVGRMLEADEPLKPAMIIFARVNEQISELIAYINNRLERFPSEEAELFGALDAASYTASITLKKVFSVGFAGLPSVRPAPTVYASVETAYSVLNESFQQILAGLTRIVDPSADVGSMFPPSRVSLDRSVVLRDELWGLVRFTQAAEQKPEKAEIRALNNALRKFMGGTVRFLFYKDTETFERFVEEILVTRRTKDLVPILHRFGAYLETLFGQVSLRSVLEDHPFERN